MCGQCPIVKVNSEVSPGSSGIVVFEVEPPFAVLEDRRLPSAPGLTEVLGQRLLLSKTAIVGPLMHVWTSSGMYMCYDHAEII